MRKTLLAGSAAIAAFLACHVTLAAPIVNIGTGLNKDIDAPSGIASMVMSLTNTGDAPAEINIYGFAIMAIQTSGTSTLSLTGWSAPPLNPLLGGNTSYDPTDPPGTNDLISPVNFGGTDYYTYFGPLTGADNDGLNWQLTAGSTKNIGTLTFQAGTDVVQGDAWDVFAVSQSVIAPQIPPSFYMNSALSVSVFGNLPAADGQALKIGTITAVPEPSTISLAGIGLLAAGWAARRRIRRVA